MKELNQRSMVQICPLSFASPRSTCPCLKEDCAWWHLGEPGLCAVRGLGDTLAEIAHQLGLISLHAGER